MNTLFIQNQVGVQFEGAQVPDALTGAVMAIESQLSTIRTSQGWRRVCDQYVGRGLVHDDILDNNVREVSPIGLYHAGRVQCQWTPVGSFGKSVDENFRFPKIALPAGVCLFQLM